MLFAHFSFPSTHFPPPSKLSPPIFPGTPNHINFEEVKEDLEEIDGVKQAHSLHIWSLTLDKVALAAHLVLGKGQGVTLTDWNEAIVTPNKTNLCTKYLLQKLGNVNWKLENLMNIAADPGMIFL